MRKFGFSNIHQNQNKTFPTSMNMYAFKSKPQWIEDQENVTLIVKRRNSVRQKQWRCTFASIFRFVLTKKLVLLLILACMCVLILIGNTDFQLKKNIFSVFLSSRSQDMRTSANKSPKPFDLQNTFASEKFKLIVPVINLKISHFLLNYSSSQIDKSPRSKGFSSAYNIFVIYTRENYHLHMKFDLFVHSLLKHTSTQLHLHVITDKNSEGSVLDILQRQIKRFRRSIIYTMYDVKVCSSIIQDIAENFSPFFTSAPNSYYSDSLFFLSLGLHRIADLNFNRAILLDCDIVFRSDVRLLFAEFENFLPHQLFGLAPELTPVYRHILYRYRLHYPKTHFGDPYYPMQKSKNKEKLSAESTKSVLVSHGYPGLNSGVVLLFLNRIRNSKVYMEKLLPSEIQRLVTKYSFKGHLGDQDYFTLLGYEYPNLIYRLDCVWNRQLCTWWKDHGYSDIFDAYFRCDGVIKMYHGNCNTRIPE